MTLRWVASIGAGNCFNQLAMLISQIVLNNSPAALRRPVHLRGGHSLAVAGIVMKVSQLCFGVIIGISQGSQPIEASTTGPGSMTGSGKPTGWP